MVMQCTPNDHLQYSERPKWFRYWWSYDVSFAKKHGQGQDMMMDVLNVQNIYYWLTLTAWPLWPTSFLSLRADVTGKIDGNLPLLKHFGTRDVNSIILTVDVIVIEYSVNICGRQKLRNENEENEDCRSCSQEKRLKLTSESHCKLFLFSYCTLIFEDRDLVRAMKEIELRHDFQGVLKFNSA